jgi:vancomycin resistance protein YoaR
VYGAARPGHPKIFDLPDDKGGDKAGGDGTIVLGGAAAAEGRTTGPTPRIAGPAAGASRSGGTDDDTGGQRGRHFSVRSSVSERDWLPLALVGVPVVFLVLLIGGWAVDTAALSGQVVRNVEIAGRPVGGLGEASLPEVMNEISDEVAARPVVVSIGNSPGPALAGPGRSVGGQPTETRQYETTAGALGLSVDSEATADAALDAGRSDMLLARPLTWFASFFSPRDVDVRYSVKESQVVATMLQLQGPEVVPPQDPTIQLGDQGWVPVPGAPGEGVDTEAIAAHLPEAAAADPDGTIEVETEVVPLAPRFTDEEAQALADQANTWTANGLTLTAGDSSKQVSPEQLRSWIAPTTANGILELAIQPDVVNAALPELFADVSSEAVDAKFDLQNGTPVVVPSRQGIVCCGPTSPDLVFQALQAGETSAALEVQVTEPRVTTETAQGLGIVQPVGGNNAWQNGAPTTAGPGFTTYHDCCAPRVTNIHRMADIVRGTVVMPGETFSVNDTVGPRTTAKGFVPAGAIAQGEHVDEVGGGVSQFATTTFNAAYFAGLDIPVYQAHSEYFSRYPLGREATMGYPNPDLQFTNNTPYGIMIWTSYTDTSLTVTLYSTPHVTGQQTGSSEEMEGQCRVVTTTRTRTWPDGRTENDTFKARYRPGAGLNCNGEPINPGGPPPAEPG